MTYVVDSGGVTALAMERETMVTHINRGQWPPEVPAIVPADCLTGDHRRDHAANRVRGLCMVRDVSESVSRRAAALRTWTARAASISAVVAVVVAMAEAVEHGPVVSPRLPRELEESGTPALQRRTKHPPRRQQKHVWMRVTEELGQSTVGLAVQITATSITSPSGGK